MPKPARAGIGAAIVCAVLALAACGGTVIDDGKAEDAVQSDLENRLNVQIASVDCPSDVDVEAGKKFDCHVTATNGQKATATLKILDDDANVAFVDFKPAKK